MGKKSTHHAGSCLGKSIIRDRFRAQGSRDDIQSMLHTTQLNDGASYTKFQSITEQSDLEQFLTTAELAGTDFAAERRNIHMVSASSSSTDNDVASSGTGTTATLSNAKRNEMHQQMLNAMAHHMMIPRRPIWKETMTAEELHLLEREAFLTWRRSLARLQEAMGEEEGHVVTLTPFERNLEVWRQLWRVVERSDMVVQIVDARNPLLYRSIDLERYVKEVDEAKLNLLLINKSDMLTIEQRSLWAEYFQAHQMAYIFWSAEMAKNANEEQVGPTKEDEEEVPEPIRIYTREALLDVLRRWTSNQKREEGQVATVGMVGYPNVGKSSTINALCGEKRVAVAATPGKTKHFQTLLIEDASLCLCDCPGLVFPTVTTTKAELVVNGILPIDQLRDYVGPTALVCERIPRRLLQLTYGVHLAPPRQSLKTDSKEDVEARSNEDHEEDATSEMWRQSSVVPPTPHEVLSAVASMRGFMKAGHGAPDESRAARLILKDYVNGKLLYNHPPPLNNPIDPLEFNVASYRRQWQHLRDTKTSRSSIKMMLSTEKEIAVDPEDDDNNNKNHDHMQAHLSGRRAHYSTESMMHHTGGGHVITRPSSKKHFKHTKRQR